jgi:curved DNA-binding protein CbpA
MTLYDILDVPPTASPEEIKTAYRKRSRTTHPDHGGSSEEFKKVNEAYAILSKPSSRQHYDKTGQTHQDDIDNQLAALFVSILEKEPHKDPFEVARQIVAHQKKSEEKQVRDSKTTLKKLEKKLADFKKHNTPETNPQGYDLFLSILTGRITHAKMAIEAHKAAIQATDKMKERLSDLTCPSNEAPPQPSWHSFIMEIQRE